MSGCIVISAGVALLMSFVAGCSSGLILYDTVGKAHPTEKDFVAAIISAVVFVASLAGIGFFIVPAVGYLMSSLPCIKVIP